MAKKKKKKTEPHPTLFVHDGAIQHFQEGSMLELNMQITADEWKLIVFDTVKYKLFLDCLKEVAFPVLKEVWTKEDEWFRLQLEVAVGRMKNIDPFMIMNINQKDMRIALEAKINKNALEVIEEIKTIRTTQQFLNTNLIDNSRTEISDL